jgi:hypothetical protein
MDSRIKAALAGGVALAGVGVAVYLGFSAFGGGRTIRSAQQASTGPAGPGAPADEDSVSRRVELDGPPPAWMQANMDRASAYGESFVFPDTDDAMSAFDTGSIDLALRAETDDALAPLGIGPRRGLIDSWSAFMQPLLADDRDGFVGALASMGAANADAGGALFDRLSDYMRGSRVALGAARLRTIDATEPGAIPAGMPDLPGMPTGMTAIPMMVSVMETQDDDGNTTTIREMNVPLSSVFPEAAAGARDGARTVEVWAPAKLPGAKGDRADTGPGLYFVFDEGARRWQPVAMRLALVSEAAASKLESVMRSRRGATQD